MLLFFNHVTCTHVQESEIEAAGWVTLSEYAGQDAFKEVPLHVKLAERCVGVFRRWTE